MAVEWEKIRDVFERALDVEPDARGAFLDGACDGDAALRREVEVLLAEHDGTRGLPLGTHVDARAVAAALGDAAPPDALEPGTQLDGRYRVDALIGRGGMGEVYRARDLRLGRDVAVKVLPAAFASDADRLRRFELEARAAGRLSHPNVLDIHDVGVHEGAPFVVSELLEGESLRARLKRGPMGVGEAVELATGIARGLGAAHAKGIVHRDLKPENVFVMEDGRAKVLDFGLAKLVWVEAKSHETESTLVGEPTESGVVMGTVGYMSPEQLLAEPVDCRSDVFAFGAVLYEMVTGRAAFRRKTPAETMSAILNDDPPRLESASGPVPEGLERVVRRCLEKRPEGRYETGGELERALETSLDAAHGAGPTAVRAGGARRWWAVAAVAALAASLGLGGFFYNVRGPGSTVASAPSAQSIAVLPFEPLVAESRDPALELGMTDTLISKLSRVRAVAVRPTSAVMRYAGQATDPRTTGAELGVDVLLEGKVQRAGDRIRLSVQLVRASDGAAIWAETFDERFTDVFAVQDSISQRVASALALRLSTDEQRGLARHDTESAEAYDLYLQGRFRQSTFASEDVLASINFFRGALARDPNYALAHAGLADAYSILGLVGPLPTAEAMAKAKASAERAIELDDSVAEAHLALAAVKIFHEWDWPGADRELARALELDPTQADAYTFRGHSLQAAGRPVDAVAEYRRARHVAPHLPIATSVAATGLSVPRQYDNDVVSGLFVARQYDETIAEALRVVERDPGNAFSYSLLSRAYVQKGMYAEAAAANERAHTVSSLGSPQPPVSLLLNTGHLYAVTGKRREALEVIEKLRAGGGSARAFYVATVYATLGDRDQAFAWLETAYDERYPFVWRVKVDPRFDTLRADPRYVELLGRMNLAP